MSLYYNRENSLIFASIFRPRPSAFANGLVVERASLPPSLKLWRTSARRTFSAWHDIAWATAGRLSSTLFEPGWKELAVPIGFWGIRERCDVASTRWTGVKGFCLKGTRGWYAGNPVAATVPRRLLRA